MIFRSLDENGDWTFGKGLANYQIDTPAIALNIKTRLLSWVGDCFFDEGAGVDWNNRLGSKDQRKLLEDDIRRIILQSQGVRGIIDFQTELNAATRAFKASYNIITIFSQEYQDTLEVGGLSNA